MSPRRVFVTLELETDASLRVLRAPANWAWETTRVLQVQANVARPGWTKAGSDYLRAAKRQRRRKP